MLGKYLKCILIFLCFQENPCALNHKTLNQHHLTQKTKIDSQQAKKLINILDHIENV